VIDERITAERTEEENYVNQLVFTNRKNEQLVDQILAQ
tara:strand:+ start:810 stop:923 length:114 start_codon:yes stop_codon:yes gene_type:complete